MNTTSVSENSNEILEIKWEEIEKLPLKDQSEYYNSLAKKIIAAPINNPEEVSLDGRKYVIDEKFKEILKLCYAKNNEVLKRIKGEMLSEPSYEIDWERVKTLNPEQRAAYFKRLAERLIHTNIVNPILVRNKYTSCVIDRRDLELFNRCYEEYEKALSGVSFIDKKKAQKRNSSFFSNLKKNFAKKKESKKKKNPTQEQENKSNMTSNVFAIVSLSVALGLSISAIVWGLNQITGEKGKENDDNKFSLTEMIDEFKTLFHKNDNLEDDNVVIPEFDFHEFNNQFLNPRAPETSMAPEFIDTIEEKLEDEKEGQRLAAFARKQALIDSYIEEYCIYFNLNTKKVQEIARAKTDGYRLPFDDLFYDDLYDLSDLETACMVFVRQLSRDKLSFKLSEFGLTKDDLVISDEVLTVPKGQDFIMRNGETATEFLGRICDMLGLNKAQVLAISFHETGIHTSNICHNKNNFGGLRYDVEFLTYPSPEAGIIALCMNFKNYEKYHLRTWEEMSSLYVYGSRSAEPSYNWIEKVQYYLNTINNNYEEYFGESETVNSIVDRELYEEQSSGDKTFSMAPIEIFKY